MNLVDTGHRIIGDQSWDSTCKTVSRIDRLYLICPQYLPHPKVWSCSRRSTMSTCWSNVAPRDISWLQSSGHGDPANSD